MDSNIRHSITRDEEFLDHSHERKIASNGTRKMIDAFDDAADMVSPSSTTRPPFEDGPSGAEVVFRLDGLSRPNQTRPQTPEGAQAPREQRQNAPSPMRRRVENMVDRLREQRLDQHHNNNSGSSSNNQAIPEPSAQGDRPLSYQDTREDDTTMGDAHEDGEKVKAPPTEEGRPAYDDNTRLGQTSNSDVQQWLVNLRTRHLDAPMSTTDSLSHNAIVGESSSSVAAVQTTSDMMIEFDPNLQGLDIEVDEGFINENGAARSGMDEFAAAALAKVKARTWKRSLQMNCRPSSADAKLKCHKLVRRPARMRRRKEIRIERQPASLSTTDPSPNPSAQAAVLPTWQSPPPPSYIP